MPSTALLFPDCFSLLSTLPPPLISNFESALWNSGKIKEAETLFPKIRKGNKEQLLCLGGRHRVPVPPSPPSLEGNRCCTRKGLFRILDREVSHELSRGTQFSGIWFSWHTQIG